MQEQVMPVVVLREEASFDSEVTRLLGTAFEAAWERLKTSGTLADQSQAPLARELLAKRIIDVAKRGERNQDRLVESALVHLGVTPDIAGAAKTI
jgi:hypothetical protein